MDRAHNIVLERLDQPMPAGPTSSIDTHPALIPKLDISLGPTLKPITTDSSLSPPSSTHRLSTTPCHTNIESPNLYISNPDAPNQSPTSDSPNNHNNLPPDFNSSSSTSNLDTQKSNPLKRKVTKEELETFAKRLKILIEGPEVVYFDPKTATLIPQSQLENFMLTEKDKPNNPCPLKIRGESLKSRAQKNTSQSTTCNVSPNSISCSSIVFMAEEAGLTMPPTPQWKH